MQEETLLHEEIFLHEGYILHKDTFARGVTFTRRHFCTGQKLILLFNIIFLL